MGLPRGFDMSGTIEPSIPAAPPGYRRGVALVLAAGVCWSSMGLGIRAMETANAWQILFYRSLALALFLGVVLAVRCRGNPSSVIGKAGIAGVGGGLGLVVAFAGGIYAIQATSVANATFLFASGPFLAALLGWWLLGERVRTATKVAMACALAGIVLMVVEDVSLGRADGNVAAMLSALGFAVFTIALRWKKTDDMLPAAFLAGVFATAAAAGVCFQLDYPLALPARDILIALALGVFQIGLGLILYTIGSKSVPAAELGLLVMTEVILGPFWVWLVIDETVGAQTLAGGAFLLLAITGNAVSGLRHKPPPVM